MSGSVPPTQFPQGQSSALGSGIVGLFIKGIEAGLVFAQFSQWFYGSGRRESSLLSTVIVFVTVVGLAQSGLCFASAWSKYVQQFGVFPLLDWEDYVQPIPTLVISVPVQALMIRRCYYLVGKSTFTIAARVTSSSLDSCDTMGHSFSHYICDQYQGEGPRSFTPMRSWLFLMSVLLPSGKSASFLIYYEHPTILSP
ncbi:hypothetical protein EDB89DRAFT_2246843 [Lactarius sanguifluus]|nr:hypothetical protein EDB89DRAFT_2246843 [Lactarius sanguifluus]